MTIKSTRLMKLLAAAVPEPRRRSASYLVKRQPVVKLLTPTTYQVESLSKAGKFYEVAAAAVSGYTCNCPAWIYQTGSKKVVGERRDCKHIVVVRKARLTHTAS